MLQHIHLILELECAKPPKDAQEATAFLEFLIKRIDMNIAKADTMPRNPMGYYCDAAGNQGVTAVGILETSHTVLHSWDMEYPCRFSFDLYSCKDFKVEDVIYLCNSFGIVRGSFMLIDRNTTLKLVNSGLLGENGIILPDSVDSDIPF